MKILFGLSSLVMLLIGCGPNASPPNISASFAVSPSAPEFKLIKGEVFLSATQKFSGINIQLVDKDAFTASVLGLQKHFKLRALQCQIHESFEREKKVFLEVQAKLNQTQPELDQLQQMLEAKQRELADFNKVKYLRYEYKDPVSGKVQRISWHDSSKNIMPAMIEQLKQKIEINAHHIAEQKAIRSQCQGSEANMRDKIAEQIRATIGSSMSANGIALDAEKAVTRLGGPAGVRTEMAHDFTEAINASTVDQSKADSDGKFEFRIGPTINTNFLCFAFHHTTGTSLCWLVPVQTDAYISTGYREIRMDSNNSLNQEQFQDTLKDAAISNSLNTWLDLHH